MCTVLLAGGSSTIGRYVHHETDEWVLTSDQSTAHLLHECDESSVYTELLPGRLGMFVYPSDVRFHLRNKARTSRADFDAVVCTERTLINRERTLNTHNLTLSQDTYDESGAFVPNEEERDDSEDEEDEEEEEGEEEQDGLDEECPESDEENDS